MEAGVPFLPLLEELLADSRWPDWLLEDGLHLNPEGHRQMFERVRRWPALLQWAGLHAPARAASLRAGPSAGPPPGR